MMMRLRTLLYVSCMLVLSACASPQEHKALARDGQPVLLEHGQMVRARDGMNLVMRRWLPGAPPKAIIIALHGFNDYSNAFSAFASDMNEHHIGVYAYDQRGFGVSGTRGLWAGTDNLVQDAADVADAVQTRHPDTPIYMLGSSMGGAVTMLASARALLPDGVQGIILAAPAVWGGEAMGWLYRLPLWIATRVAPGMAVTGNDMGIIPSDNFAMLQSLSADPFVIKSTRIDAIYGIVGLMEDAYQAADALKHPALLLYGADDQVIPKEPTLHVAQSGSDMHVIYYPRGFHMLLRDLQAMAVYDDIVYWVRGNNNVPFPSGNAVNARTRLADDIAQEESE